jgi:hypothetical protein
MSTSRFHKLRRWRWPLLIISLFAVLAWSGDRQLKQRDHPGLATFLKQWSRNYPASFAVEPITLELTVEEAELAQLERVVEEARERGVILPEGNDPVSATISGPSGTFKAKVRIKGKLTDHVKGNKWSFRVIAKKDEGFLGMRRFSLQHPGTRNYLCDWLYHRLMEGEGVIALRYGFIRLTFNGDDLGVYAYEEHFGPELLEHNGRVKGPLFRFDPALFWEHRLNMMNKVRYEEPFAAYQAADIDAFGSSDLEKDDQAREQFQQAVTLMEAFRRAERPASEVFNVDLIARRHAILDLVGGHHSMDWSDVKFYYDPVVRRIEPVAYESFSAFPLATLAGSDRWIGRHDPSQDLHDALFNDEPLFRAYIGHLERLARPAYLDSVFAALAPALDSASATIYREFPYKELDRGIYYRNQKVIQRLLNVPKPFHAYYNGRSADTLAITVVPIEAIPMQVHGLVLPDGSVVRPLAHTIVPIRKKGQPGQPVTVRFLVPNVQPKLSASDIQLVSTVLGGSVERKVEVAEHAFVLGPDRTLGVPPPSDLQRFPFLGVDTALRTITLLPGDWDLVEDLSLPEGYTIQATAPLRITFAPGVRLISRSPLNWVGLEEAPIRLQGSGDGQVLLLGAKGSSKWEQVVIDRVGTVVVQSSNMRLVDVSLTGDTAHTLIEMVRAKVTMVDVALNGGYDQVSSQSSTVSMERVTGMGSADDAIRVRGGKLDMQGCVLAAPHGVALKGAILGVVGLTDCQLSGAKQAVVVEEGCHVRAQGGLLKGAVVAVELEDAKGRYGPSTLELDGVRMDAPRDVDAGKGNTVRKGAEESDKVGTHQ